MIELFSYYLNTIWFDIVDGLGLVGAITKLTYSPSTKALIKWEDFKEYVKPTLIHYPMLRVSLRSSFSKEVMSLGAEKSYLMQSTANIEYTPVLLKLNPK